MPCESVAFVPTVRQTPASRAWNVTLCQGRAAPPAVRGRAVTSTRRPTGPDGGAETTTLDVAGAAGQVVPVQVRPWARSIARSRSVWSVVTRSAPRSSTRCRSVVALGVQVPTGTPAWCAAATVSAVSAVWRTSISVAHARSARSPGVTLPSSTSGSSG